MSRFLIPSLLVVSGLCFGAVPRPACATEKPCPPSIAHRFTRSVLGDDVTEIVRKPKRRFQKTKIKSQFLLEGEDTGGTVTYLRSAAEREKYRLRFGADGLIYEASGELFDTSEGFRVDDEKIRTKTGRAIFVMDEDGNFYAALGDVQDQFHHSSFLGGKPVAAAGELRVVKGKLELFTDRSGHYLPRRRFTAQALKWLGEMIGRGQIDALKRARKVQIQALD